MNSLHVTEFRGRALVPLLCCLILGCGSLSKPYPEKNLHVLSVGEPPTAVQSQAAGVLRIEAMRIAKPFDATTFVYKVGRSEFTTDYYAGFLSTPDRILGAELDSWLAHSGLYSSVITGNSSANYRWVLESNILSLYGDY